MLEKKDYQDAMCSQNACNLSGIINSFNKILPKIWAEAREKGKGTDWVNNHPISVLFAEQIMYLSDQGPITYLNAYTICMERAE